MIDMGDFFTPEAHSVTKSNIYYPDTRNTLEHYEVHTKNETKTYYVWNQLFSCDLVRTELAPFSSVRFFGDLTGGLYDPKGESMGIVAQKS